MKYMKYPIKIESINKGNSKPMVKIFLDMFHTDKIRVTMYRPNRWIINALRSKLSPNVIFFDDSSLVLDVKKETTLKKFESILNKKEIMQYKIEYKYDDSFFRGVCSSFYENYFISKENREKIDIVCGYYEILDCPIGCDVDTIKRKYRQLAKTYHPDRLHNKDSKTIKEYTVKFQVIQDAYNSLIKGF